MKYEPLEYVIHTEQGPMMVKGYKVGKYTAIRNTGPSTQGEFWTKDHLPTGRKIPIGINDVRETARLICLAFKKETTGRGVSLNDPERRMLTKPAVRRIKAYGLLIDQQKDAGLELESYESYLEGIK